MKKASAEMAECKLMDKLLSDMKAAMKQNDKLSRDCLRGIIAEIKNQSINAGKPLTEELCVGVLKKAAKLRDDAVESFKAGGREDMALKEMQEKKLIESYLPKMLSEEQVQCIVLETVNANKIPEVKASMGTIMKLLSARPDSILIDKKVASRYLNVLLK